MQKDLKGEAPEPNLPLVVELVDVCKSFGAVKANKNISLQVEQGTVHGIVGENGAGKSTLMNILYGVQTADSGEIRINGNPVTIRSSADAISLGIGMVHQHFMLVPNFTVLENVILGREGGNLLAEGEEKTLERLKELSSEYDMDVDPHALIEDLPVGIRQRVEIIKAIKDGAQILILDEPTGVLTPQETNKLFKILNTLRERGVTVLIITHKLSEIMAITDNVTVIQNGEVVGNRKTSETSTGELAELMVGREVLLMVKKGKASPGEVRLQVDSLEYKQGDNVALLEDISFELRAGEILGVAGVAGNGQTELMEVLSGMLSPTGGSFEILGHSISQVTTKTPDKMRTIGVSHIPEDRHEHGLILEFEAQENLVLGYHQTALTGEGLLLNQNKIKNHSEALIMQFDVRPRDPQLKARNFSGGNQQKLVIAREMNANPKLLIVGQPTRGVDIGAIEFIHKQLIALRNEGCAILLVSVELDEILGLSDRIMIMNNGRQVGIINRNEADERTLGLMMAGISKEEAA